VRQGCCASVRIGVMTVSPTQSGAGEFQHTRLLGPAGGIHGRCTGYEDFCAAALLIDWISMIFRSNRCITVPKSPAEPEDSAPLVLPSPTHSSRLESRGRGGDDDAFTNARTPTMTPAPSVSRDFGSMGRATSRDMVSRPPKHCRPHTNRGETSPRTLRHCRRELAPFATTAHPLAYFRI